MFQKVLLNNFMGGARKNKPEKPKRRALTPEELDEARKLRAIYEAKKKQLRLTQETLAEQMGWSTQGAVSQYMQGRIPLSNEVLLRFAHILEFNPCEIRPDIFDRIPIGDVNLAGDIGHEALTWARRFSRLPEGDRKYLMELIRRLSSEE